MYLCTQHTQKQHKHNLKMDFYSDSRTLTGDNGVGVNSVAGVIPIEVTDVSGYKDYQVELAYDNTTLVVNMAGELQVAAALVGTVSGTAPIDVAVAAGNYTVALDTDTTLHVVSSNLSVDTPQIVDGTTLKTLSNKAFVDTAIIVDGTTLAVTSNKAHVVTTAIVDGTTLTVASNKAQVDTSAIVDGASIKVTANEAYVDTTDIVDGSTIVSTLGKITGNYTTSDSHLSISGNSISTIDVASAASLAAAEGDIAAIDATLASFLVFPAIPPFTTTLTLSAGITAASAAAAAAAALAGTKQDHNSQLDNLSTTPPTMNIASGTFAITDATTTGDKALVSFFQSSLTSGGSTYLLLGTTGTNFNAGYMLFHAIGGSGSTSNRLEFGLTGTANRITIDGTGVVRLPAATTIAGTVTLSSATPMIDITSGTLRISDGTTTGTKLMTEFLQFSSALNSATYITVGVNTFNFNTGLMLFNNLGGFSSTANRLELGLTGSANRLTIDGTGFVTIPANVAIVGNVTTTVTAPQLVALNAIPISSTADSLVVAFDGNWSTWIRENFAGAGDIYYEFWNKYNAVSRKWLTIRNDTTTFSSPNVDFSGVVPTCATAPTIGSHLTNKTYVDTAISTSGGSYQPLNTNLTNLSAAPPTLNIASGTFAMTDATTTTDKALASFTQSALASAGATYITLGKAVTNFNAGFMLFKNVGGSGSTSNQMMLGLLGSTNRFAIDGTGLVTIDANVLASTAPTLGGHLTNKTYVDAAVAGGGGPFQPLNANLTNLSASTPTLDTTPGTFNVFDNTNASAKVMLSALQSASVAETSIIVGQSATTDNAAAISFNATTGLANFGILGNTDAQIQIDVSGLTTFVSQVTVALPTTITTERPITSYIPSLQTGQATLFEVGVDDNTNNAAQLGFQNVGGYSDASNTLTLGLNFATPITIDTAGNVFASNINQSNSVIQTIYSSVASTISGPFTACNITASVTGKPILFWATFQFASIASVGATNFSETFTVSILENNTTSKASASKLIVFDRTSTQSFNRETTFAIRLGAGLTTAGDLYTMYVNSSGSGTTYVQTNGTTADGWASELN